MNIVLRDLKTSDRAPLASLLARIAVFDAEDRSVAMELLGIVLEQPGQKDYLCIVAAGPKDMPLGYACFGPTPLTEGTFDLYWIAVDPACAGQGVGTRLLQGVEEQVRQAQGRMMVLETSSMQCYAQTRQFYLKCGYTLAETIPDFYCEGEDRVTYLKRLR